MNPHSNRRDVPRRSAVARLTSFRPNASWLKPSVLGTFVLIGLQVVSPHAAHAANRAPVVKDLDLPARSGTYLLARLDMTDPDGDALTVTPHGATGNVGTFDSRGFFLYTPPLGSGPFDDVFTVDVSDGTAITTANITIHVVHPEIMPLYVALGASDVQGYGASDYGATYNAGTGSYDKTSFSPALAYAPQVNAKLAARIPTLFLSRRAINGLTLTDAFGAGTVKMINLAGFDQGTAYSVAFGPNDVLYELLPLLLSNPTNLNNSVVANGIATNYVTNWSTAYNNVKASLVNAAPNAKFAAISVPDLGPGLTAAFGGALNSTQKTNLSAALTSACAQMTTTIKADFPTVDLQGNADLVDPAGADSGLVLNPATDLFLDGFHPNDSGYSKLSTRLFRLLAPQLNNAPTAISLSPQTVKENLPSGSFVGGLSSTDPDSGETFTYSLPAGVGDNASFAIDGTNLRTAAVFDAAVKSSYSITVRTTDAFGKFFEQPFTINVLETSKPAVAITSPTTNQKVLLANLTGSTISGTATDNIGVTAVKVRLSRKRNGVNAYWNGTDFVATQSYVDADVPAIPSAIESWNLSTHLPPANKLDNGTYDLQVYALDAAANKSAYATTSFTLSADLTAPTLAITTPTANQKVVSSTIDGNTISGTATDDTAVTAVKVRLSTKSNGTTYYWNGTAFTTTSAYVDANVGAGTWNLGAKTPSAGAFDPGTYTVEAYALDAAANKSVAAKVSFTVSTDFIAPTVTITTPTQNQIININSFTAGTLSGSADDNQLVTSVKLKLQRKRGAVTEYFDGTSFTTTVAYLDATYSSTTGVWSYDSAISASVLDKGSYTLYATAYDAAGNYKTSSSRSFSVTGTPATAPAAAAKSAGNS